MGEAPSSGKLEEFYSFKNLSFCQESVPIRRPMVCSTFVWAGVDSAWEQEKPEATLPEIPKNAARKAPLTSGTCLLAYRLLVNSLFE